MRREIIKASPEHEASFRATWKLRKEVEGNPIWQMAYEHAATTCLYPDEMNAIGAVLERKDNESKTLGN